MPCQDTLQLDLPRRAVGFGSGCCIESLLALLLGIIIKDGAEVQLLNSHSHTSASLDVQAHLFLKDVKRERKRETLSLYMHFVFLCLFA